ncbi:MAG: LamG domain-containing protein [Dehalococcoidia bacterium]|jgi:hypothetical protein|nr:LamG domain-containing protein [Dehalococcoidia bacterium]
MSIQTEIAAAVWAAETRTLASGSPDDPTTPQGWIAKGVWEAATRTLTGEPQTGLLLHYLCEDNAASTTVTDNSGYGNTGTASVNTSTLSAAGKISLGFNFTGTQYVLRNSFAAVSKDLSWTATFWFKSSSNNTTRTLLANTVSATDLMVIRYVSTSLRVGVYNGTAYTSKSGTAAINVWHHVAAVWSGSAWTLYLDGVVQTGTTSPTSASTTAGFGLGSSSVGGTPAIAVMDDVRVYDSALTASQVRAIRASNNGTVLGTPWAAARRRRAA